MPTSKDILKDAQKVYDTHKFAKKAYEDSIKIGQEDNGAFGKARAQLNTSISSLKGSCETLEDRLKNLNKGLTELKKNEAVMKAPADAKVYASLTKDYEGMIKEGMTFYKKLQETLKTSLSLIKK